MRHALTPGEVTDLISHYAPKQGTFVDGAASAWLLEFLARLQPAPGDSSLRHIKVAADACEAAGYPDWVYSCSLTGIEWAYYEGDGYCAFCGRPHMESGLAPALRGYLYGTKQPVCAACARTLRGWEGK